MSLQIFAETIKRNIFNHSRDNSNRKKSQNPFRTNEKKKNLDRGEEEICADEEKETQRWQEATCVGEMDEER